MSIATHAVGAAHLNLLVAASLPPPVYTHYCLEVLLRLQTSLTCLPRPCLVLPLAGFRTTVISWASIHSSAKAEYFMTASRVCP
jgi:hypothetical protein